MLAYWILDAPFDGVPPYTKNKLSTEEVMIRVGYILGLGNRRDKAYESLLRSYDRYVWLGLIGSCGNLH